jgi:hemerythrin
MVPAPSLEVDKAMTKITWNDAYLVGVEEIDAHHRDFVRLVVRLQILDEKKGSRNMISRLLLEMNKHLEYHFVSEENLMFLAKFRELEGHKREHERILTTLQEKCKAYEAREISISPIIDILSDWFCRHTQTADRLAGEQMSLLARLCCSSDPTPQPQKPSPDDATSKSGTLVSPPTPELASAKS